MRVLVWRWLERVEGLVVRGSESVRDAIDVDEMYVLKIGAFFQVLKKIRNQ